MFLSCKCLNIFLKYSGRHLAPRELSLPTHPLFLDNPLLSTTDNFAVLKRQPSLIDEEVIAPWTVTRCINCSQYTYALADNPDNSKDKLQNPLEFLAINKSLITVDNLPSDNSESSPPKVDNPDNPRLPNDNSDTISTKMTLMPDNSLLSDKTMIFSDNVPLITDQSTTTSDNSAITNDNSSTNSTISIDNSITSRSTSNINDNSLITSDNSGVINDNLNLASDTLTLVSDNTTLIGDNSKISSDNSTMSDDNSLNKNDIFLRLRSHPDYSDIYNVIVTSDVDNRKIDDNDILMMKKKLLPGVQLSLGNLQQQYEAKVKDITDIVEDNIKKFIAKQYLYLDNYKERGHHHYCVLSDKILRNELRKIKSDNPGVITHGDNFGDNRVGEGEKTGGVSIVRPITNDNFIVPGSLIFSERGQALEERGEVKRERGQKRPKRKQPSDNDYEVMFAIEGMEVEEKETDNEEGESDDSGQDEGIHIPRVQRGGGHPTLAKSLPVSVPNFWWGHRSQRHNDGQQSAHPLDPHNIRASIKALAKSVHGDTVFGDLPRPRFSTEI